MHQLEAKLTVGFLGLSPGHHVDCTMNSFTMVAVKRSLEVTAFDSCC